jgi:hypothetical protein
MLHHSYNVVPSASSADLPRDLAPARTARPVRRPAPESRAPWAVALVGALIARVSK